MNQEQINRMRHSSQLLPPPGGEVVRGLLKEVEFLQRIISRARTMGKLYEIIVKPCPCGRYTIDERYLIRSGVYHVAKNIADVADLSEARALYENYIGLRESKYNPETNEYTGLAEWEPYSDDPERDNFIVSRWHRACERCK